jgi:energy-coupling factor transport system substrate-specific component
MTDISTSSRPSIRVRARWRVIDIVIASVLGVAVGLVFVVWNVASNPITEPLSALLPGLQGLGHGVWLIGGVLTGLVIRKPGAALYGELVAATVSALIGNQWGPLTLVSGLTQGIGAELVFLLFAYSTWRVWVALLAGAAAGLAMAATDLVLWYAGADLPFAATYVVASAIGGAFWAGLLSWFAMRGLAASGALDRFASGRERSREV